MTNQPFPRWSISYLIWGVPLVELAIAGLLWWEPARKIALWASTIVMAVFTGYIGLVLLHIFPYVPCSCGGVIEGFTWGQHLFFNLFFLAISIIGIVLNKRNQASNQINNLTAVMA